MKLCQLKRRTAAATAAYGRSCRGRKRRSVGIFMTIQSTQQLPIKIFPQKTTTTHTHTYTDIERETDERTGGRTDQKWNAEQNNRRKQRKKGFCVRLINCFAHVFRAKCSPERINPTTQKPRTSRPIDPPSRGSQTIVRLFRSALKLWYIPAVGAWLGTNHHWTVSLAWS